MIFGANSSSQVDLAFSLFGIRGQAMIPVQLPSNFKGKRWCGTTALGHEKHSLQARTDCTDTSPVFCHESNLFLVHKICYAEGN